MFRSSIAPSTAVARLECVRPLGFDALVSRLLRIQIAVAECLAVHSQHPQLGSLAQRASRASAYLRVALEVLSGGRPESLPSFATDVWLMRLALIRHEPERILAHGISALLHDLGANNRAHQLACRFVPVAKLGPPSPVSGLTTQSLLTLPIAAEGQAATVEELQRVVGLHEAVCDEIHSQFVA